MSVEKEWMLSIINPFFEVDDKTSTPDAIEIPNSKESSQSLQTRYQTLKSSYSIQTYKVLSSSFSFLYENLKPEQWSSLGREFVIKHAMKEPQLGLIVDLFYTYCLNKSLSQENLLHLKKDWAYITSKREKFIQSSCVKNITTLQNDPLLSFQKSVFTIESEALVISRDERTIYENPICKNQLQALLALKDKKFKLLELVEILEKEDKIADFISKAINGNWLITHD